MAPAKITTKTGKFLMRAKAKEIPKITIIFKFCMDTMLWLIRGKIIVRNIPNNNPATLALTPLKIEITERFLLIFRQT